MSLRTLERRRKIDRSPRFAALARRTSHYRVNALQAFAIARIFARSLTAFVVEARREAAAALSRPVSLRKEA